MGTTLGCELDATRYGLDVFKQLEGHTKKVQPDPRCDPETYVTVLEISKRDSGSIRFSPVAFTLRDIVIRLSIEVIATKVDLVGAAAAHGFRAVAGKLGASEEKQTKVKSSIMRAAHRMSKASAAKSRTVQVEVTVDFVKAIDSEAVLVRVKDVHTNRRAVEGALSISALRRSVEAVISERATEVATRLIAKHRQNILC